MGGVKDMKLLRLEDRFCGPFAAPLPRLRRPRPARASVVGERTHYARGAGLRWHGHTIVSGLLVQGNGKLSTYCRRWVSSPWRGLRMFPALQQIYNSLTRMRFIGPMLDNVHRDMLQTYIAPAKPSNATAAPLSCATGWSWPMCIYAYPAADRAALRWADPRKLPRIPRSASSAPGRARPRRST